MKFGLNDKVKLLPLDLLGRVTGIFTAEEGTTYRVRYFYDGKAESVYFYEDELEAMK